MPIQEQNIVFVRSQVMDDVPEGGGAATGTVIPDGVMNNVFEDISDLDRAYGRFNLRKLFLAVRTLSTDLYGGAKTLITRLPTDPALSYTLFTTQAPFDVRTDAAGRVEAYLYKGPTWPGVLSENHITGMRQISVLQRVNTRLPTIGKTLCLVEDEGLSGQKEQYVRVIQVDVTETTFTDERGDYTRWVVRLTLSDALRHDFDGHSASREDNYNYTGKTRLRDTTVADVTRYYGSQPLAAATQIGDLTVRARSLFTQLVSSAQTETPLVNQLLAGSLAPRLAARATPLTYTVAGAQFWPNQRFYLRGAAMPGTIRVSLGTTVTDDGQGNAMWGSTVVGAWNYETGECQFNGSVVPAGGDATVTYQPAAVVAQQAHSFARAVTVENRRLNWIETLVPLPAPATLTVSYMSQGNWYDLTDDGAGVLQGSDPQFGSGTLSYTTGTLTVTLGALPDADTQLLLVWASPVHVTSRTGTVTGAAHLPLPTPNVARNSLTLTYIQNGVTHTATDDGSGVLNNADGAVGAIRYTDGLIQLTVLPDMSSACSATYSHGDPLTASFTDPPRNQDGSVSITLTTPPILPRSVTLTWNTDVEVYDPETRAVPNRVDPLFIATDDGNGELRIRNGDVVGTINYTTGAITWTPDVTVSIPILRYDWVDIGGGVQRKLFTGFEYVDAGAVAPVDFDAQATYRSTDSPETVTHTAAPQLVVPLTPAYVDELVPGSVLLTAFGKTYLDRGTGILYTDLNTATGSALVAGSLDYDRATVTITLWGTAATLEGVLDACLTRYGYWDTAYASFRTPLAPLKPEALGIVATTSDGLQITGQADADGLITGPWMRGTVNYQLGVAELEFGSLIDNVWTPRFVDPGTLRYNAVAYAYIPLDASILGVDPVRLPADGRAPIYRPGDVVMILHTDTLSGTPAQVGGTGPYLLACGRTRLAFVRVTAANGDPVTAGYTLDRAAGTLSWTSLDGLATPLTVAHTVGDLRLITDVQINGELPRPATGRPASRPVTMTSAISPPTAGRFVMGRTPSPRRNRP